MRDGTGDNGGLEGKRRQGVMIIYVKKWWRVEVSCACLRVWEIIGLWRCVTALGDCRRDKWRW